MWEDVRERPVPRERKGSPWQCRRAEGEERAGICPSSVSSSVLLPHPCPSPTPSPCCLVPLPRSSSSSISLVVGEYSRKCLLKGASRPSRDLPSQSVAAQGEGRVWAGKLMSWTRWILSTAFAWRLSELQSWNTFLS